MKTWIGSARRHAWIVGCVIASAVAQTASAGEPATADVRAEIATLQAASTDADRVASLERLTRLGGHEASETVCALLNAGQSDTVTDRALETLSAIGSRDARETLGTFARHRRVAARERAYAALGKLDDPSTHASIAQGLRDSSASVRGSAARALADAGAKDQLDALFIALSKGVPEAASSIGTLGDSASVLRLKQSIGKAPLDVLLRGYQTLLCRADMADADKLGIVATLEEVSGDTVHVFLQRLLGDAQCKKSAKLLHVIQVSWKRTQPTTSGAKPKGPPP